MARRAVLAEKRLRHALVEPGRRAVEARVRREAVAVERDLLVGEERRDEAGAGCRRRALRSAAPAASAAGRRGEQLKVLAPGCRHRPTPLDGDLGQPVRASPGRSLLYSMVLAWDWSWARSCGMLKEFRRAWSIERHSASHNEADFCRPGRQTAPPNFVIMMIIPIFDNIR